MSIKHPAKLKEWIPTVRAKLFVFLCAVSLIPLLMASRVLISLGGRSTRTLAELQAREGVEEALSSLRLAQNHLWEGAKTVAAWADLSTFIKQPNSEWAAGQLASWVPQSYKLDYLAICDSIGKLLYEWHSSSAAQAPILDSLFSLPDSAQSGWISTQKDLYLAARGEVFDQGDKIGLLVFARRLTHNFLLDAKTGRGQEMAVYYGDRLLATTDTSATSPFIDPQEIFPNLVLRNEAYLYHSAKGNRCIGIQSLRNMRGAEIAALGWTSSRTPSNFVQESIDKILLFFGVPLLLLILLAALALGLWIERPIRSLSFVMERIIHTGDLSQRAPVGGGGEIALMSGTFNQMLEQLSKQRDELLAFRTMILTMREGVLIEDSQRRAIYMNPRMEELLGIRIETAAGSWQPLVVSDRITSKRLISKDERGFATEEVVWQRPDGRRIQALKTTGALEDTQGKATGVLSTFVDVTERNELELELIQASRMAFLGVYSQGIIHNLNGPLNTVLGFSTLLCHSQPEAEIPQRINKDAQRMADLIARLAHRWQRTGGSQREALDLNEIIADEIRFLEADLFFKHNVEKLLELDAELPRIFGVYGDFSHAILNVLINSIEALSESPIHKIAVRTRRCDGEIQVEVEDTGVGISAEDLDRIFLPFFSTKNRERKEGIPSGAGLGLSIARKILEPYGVQFEVRSEARRGTTMILHIPIMQNDGQDKIVASSVKVEACQS